MAQIVEALNSPAMPARELDGRGERIGPHTPWLATAVLGADFKRDRPQEIVLSDLTGALPSCLMGGWR